MPGRDLPRNLDIALRQPEDEGRLLVLSPFTYGKPSRPGKDSCAQRNRFVLTRATDRVIPHVAPGSSLADDLAAMPGT